MGVFATAVLFVVWVIVPLLLFGDILAGIIVGLVKQAEERWSKR